MKTIKHLLFLGLLYSTQFKSQYGQVYYPHDSTVLSSAQLTAYKPGHVMVGYKSYNTTTSTLADFAIDKTDAGGLFSSASEFSAKYEIWDDASCVSPARVRNCNGVSIIETQDLGNGETFAIAGVYDGGVFFATLDNQGNVIKTYRWDFSNQGGNKNKPKIRESQTNAGQYYICGDNNYDSYVLKIDALPATPVPLWNNWYSSTWLNAKDLIESPFNPNELIVVGRTDVMPSVGWAADAFFMKLDANNGAFLNAKHFNRMYDGDEWFSCIEASFNPLGGGPGFILGGRSHYPLIPVCFCTRPTNVSYTQWMCRLDQNGNIVWTTLIQPLASSPGNLSGGEISDVYERKNPVSGKYEYYGAAENYYMPAPSGGVIAANNLTVYKLDFMGGNSLTPDEFHYNKGSGTFNHGQLTAIETGGGPDDGIQAYGTSIANNSHYFVKGYFNGVSGCNENIIDIRRTFPGPDSVGNFNVMFFPFNANCQSVFSLVKTSINVNPNVFCSNTSIGSGSNAKAIKSDFNSGVEENTEMFLFPNPVSNKTIITYSSSDNREIRIEVYNALGQKINPSITNVGNTKAEIDFTSVDVPNGVYFIEATIDNITKRSKIIYTKN